MVVCEFFLIFAENLIYKSYVRQGKRALRFFSYFCLNSVGVTPYSALKFMVKLFTVVKPTA